MYSIPNDPNGKAQTKEEYESIEFALADGSTDYDLDTQQATFKTVLGNAIHYVEVFSDRAISIKFNATTNHAITISANTLRIFDRQIIKNMYLTNNSGAEANVRLYFK